MRYNFSMNFLKWIFFEIKYFGRPPWDTHVSPPELLEFLQNHPPGNALDLGCGTGTNILTMAHKGWKVTGIDFSLQAVYRARKVIRKQKFDAQVYWSDVTKINWLSEQFDFLLDIGCFHGIPVLDKEKYHQQINRLLVSNGTLLLYGHCAAEGQIDHGISPEDINRFQHYLRLEKIVYGQDHGTRSSVWITLQKP